MTPPTAATFLADEDTRRAAAVGPPVRCASGANSGSAERLRRAADLLEQRSAAASGSKWEPEYSAPLAALLRAEADHTELLDALDESSPGTVRVRLSTATEVLAVADVILGGAS